MKEKRGRCKLLKGHTSKFCRQDQTIIQSSFFWQRAAFEAEKGELLKEQFLQDLPATLEADLTLIGQVGHTRGHMVEWYLA